MMARRSDTHLEPPADPLPDGFEPGHVPPELAHRRYPDLAPSLLDGFWRVAPTTRGWLASCPCCVVAWIAIVPTDTGFAPFTPPGCSGSCDERDVIEWFAFRRGEILPEVRIARTDRARRYAVAALRNGLERITRNPATVTSEARRLGRLLPAAAIEPGAAAAVLARAAGSDPGTILPHLRAGAARPWSPP